MSLRLPSLALFVPCLVCACGGDDHGGASASSGAGITTAPAASGIPNVDDLLPTTSTGSGTGGPGTSEGDDSDALKLDIGAQADFGSPVGLGCEFIDVLFVVDVSASMNEEKANLDANFPDFVAVLDAYIADPSKEAVGYRLGVTNSSIVDNKDGKSTMGLDGALFDGDNLFDDDCDLGGRLWIDGPGANVTGSFSCLAPDPKSPCNFCTDLGRERPLDAIEMFIAKSEPGQVNAGFYRGDASLLVIVLLTDEDDDVNNTTTTPAATKKALDKFAGGDERYVVVTITGPQAAECDSAFGSAAAAPLLHEFTSLVPNGLMGDICQGDLAQALDQALALIQLSCDELPPPVG
ncbi:hypothetical protein [Nannocystis pusilla]|uniref:VWFA domain-containing protein n=1 Tax=Nannocystis pusilla TaxID=889268 RepID=A0ABS7TQN1_9BACT|nr:hypothetical protein [Nannocystis pusilla]MBZ5710486.1 hypothetical protein [Nannocystis pusilla]